MPTRKARIDAFGAQYLGTLYTARLVTLRAPGIETSLRGQHSEGTSLVLGFLDRQKSGAVTHLQHYLRLTRMYFVCDLSV